MIIRQCTDKDIAAVSRFYDHVVQYLCAHINYPKWSYQEYPSADYVRQMTAVQSQFVCMDEDNHTVIGAFVLNNDPQGAYENAAWSRQLPEGSYLVCHTLAAEPALSGTGLGTQIVNFCIDYAKKNGYPAIRLDVVPDNIPAKRLYEKCGFTYTGEADLDRGIDEIPLFSMYERNL